MAELKVLVPESPENPNGPYVQKTVGTIGENCIIESDVIIGYGELTKLRKGYETISQMVIIGDNVHIRRGTIIYAGCKIGNNVHIGHNTVIREFTTIGNNSSIGSLVMCEGYTRIGSYTTIHSQCHLTARMLIGDYVFIGPNVTTANDKRVRYYRPEIKDSPDCGPIIGCGVVIGANATILPEVIIALGCIIGAGAVITKNCSVYGLYLGVPAKRARDVKDEEVIEYLKFDYVLWKNH